MIKYVRVAHVAGNPPAPIFADAKVHGQTLRFEVDTGAGVSILPAALYTRKFADQPLQPCRLRLTTYNGETLHSQGVMCVPVEINGQRADAELYVVDCEGPPLLGRSWLEQFRLDWTAVHAITTVPASQAVQDLKARYQAVFGSDQGRMKGVQARLTLKPDAVPRFMKARSVPLALRPKVEEELHRMEKAGIVTKVDWSSWATPVVPVVKPNGKVRLCCDFKVTVNPQLCVDQHPLPLIDDIFASLSGGTRFTTLDLTAAYTQMEVEDDSRPLLTLNTHMGLYRLNRLAYGVVSAPALWQRAMDALLRDIPMVECTIDDIIISGHNDEEHLHHLEEVLTRLEKAGLRLNPQKCKFLANTVQYCGHTISKEGIHTMPSKVDAIQNAPAPETVSQVRSFVGLVTYYQRFIPDMATMLNPLTSLLQKDRQFQWTPERAAAFHQVKTVLASSKVLAHYDANLPIRVACDASPYGLGAVLSHIYPNGEERPIAFTSRKLTSAEQGYSQIDKEALGIVWAIKKFNHYLCARQFELLTDHQPLVSIFNPNKSLPGMTTARLQRYAMYLAGHQYIIKYRNTHRHCNADGLSRLPISNTASDDPEDEAIHIYYASQTDPLPVTAAQIRMQTSRDPTLASVLQFVKQGWPERCPSSELQVYFNRRNELTAHLDCLVWGNRTVIPPKLQPAVLDELHEGHPGIVRMKAIARSYVWWQGIDASLETRVKACPGCQQTQNQPAAAPLHPWMHPARPWQRVHIDFLGPLRGMMWIVAIDAHSKWPEVLPFRTTTTATDTIQALRTVFARYGCPEEIVSDNGPQFTSTDFGSFLEANGIRHRRTAPYHPATNGLAERFVQSFKRAVAAGSSSDPVQAVADKFLLCYRNTPHPTTGEPPAVLLLGRMLRTRLDLLRPDRQGKVAASQAAQAKASNRQPARWFTQGMAVLVRDYHTRQPSWIPATITSIHGPRSYDVETSAGATWTRHLDQIRAIDSSAASNMEGGRVPTRHTMPMHPSPVRDEDELPTPATTTPTQPAAPPVVSSSAPPIASSSASTTTLAVADQPPEPLRRSNRPRKAVDRLNL